MKWWGSAETALQTNKTIERNDISLIPEPIFRGDIVDVKFLQSLVRLFKFDSRISLIQIFFHKN